MIFTTRQSENMKKIAEAERLVKEAPKFSFNTNVFKQNVTLDLTKEELEAEENLVKDLAKFLKETAIKQLVAEFKGQESVPIDSESIEEAFHRNGINMRYLGEVYRQLDTTEGELSEEEKTLIQLQGEFKHLKNMIEKEITVRSAKHVFNRLLKEESGDTDLYTSQVVSHLLNCLLAPTPFLHYMNSGQLKAEDSTLQNQFPVFPETCISSPRRNS